MLGTALTALGDEDRRWGIVRRSRLDQELFLERFLIAFEAASLLLLIAAVGAVVLAGRRREASDGG